MRSPRSSPPRRPSSTASSAPRSPAPGSSTSSSTTPGSSPRSREVVAAHGSFGGGTADPVQRVQVEMVSANPTGPVTVASARNGAYGDSVARLLAFAGHTVEREYYYNDSGTQMDRFRASVDARRRGEEIPEDGYRGEYIDELAALDGDPVPHMLERIQASLERFGIHFDGWARQSVLEERLPELLPRLDTYEKDGALWARSGAYGDDDDRVLIRSATGLPTYRAADVPYLVDKLDRGYDSAIYVLGADHHSTAKLVPGDRPDARLRPRPRRGAALPVRPPHPRRRVDEDVEARRRRRAARRADRRGRRRRGPLVPRQPRPRPDDRDRRRPRLGEERQEPGLLRAVRARPDRRDPPQRRDASTPSCETTQPLAAEERDLVKRLLELPEIVAEATAAPRAARDPHLRDPRRRRLPPLLPPAQGARLRRRRRSGSRSAPPPGTSSRAASTSSA